MDPKGGVNPFLIISFPIAKTMQGQSGMAPTWFGYFLSRPASFTSLVMISSLAFMVFS
jgi:hypothetical protein